MSSRDYDSSNAIAIVGMDGRFPGASDVPTFWKNLKEGIESIALASPEPPVVRNGAAYVRAAALVQGTEEFDASFFGFNPREAETMDPQLRLFLECAWTALESAGYDSKQYSGRIGVFAGCGLSTYLTVNLMSNPDVLRSSGGALSSLGAFNDRDSLATLVSYKFDLTGPAATVQTFCSTSLVAVHLGCQSLLNGESDLVLAGAATINVTAKDGYLFTEGGILSPDGHCRAFDERAAGTIFGNGVGVVALKRLDDALADGDVLHAVIRGSAINNDGEQKAGYTAPSIVGQSKAIAEALAVAEVDPRSISYIEAHGTGTALGDPIEIEALTRAFRTGTDDRGFCAIGSVKTNIGHLDRAAGIAALIKTVLALENRAIPPSLHFDKPNPKIDFESSPFYVNTALRPWETTGAARIAGVSALGFGGTNAHVIVQEAPERPASGPSRPTQLLVVSSKTESALEKVSHRLAAHLRTHETEPLGDVAYTLQLGRRRLPHRKAVVCEDAAAGADQLEQEQDGPSTVTGFSQLTERPVVFMFPGQGAQYVNMTRGLYDGERVYRDVVDDCSRRLEPALGLDLRSVLFSDDVEGQSERLRQTAVTQPALFVVELALAKLWMSWGVKPQALIGHSVGEYVAAHLAGVFELEDALALIAERGRLMQALPPGAMLAVALPAAELASILPADLSVASKNAPALSVVSGPTDSIERFESELRERDVFCNRLQTSHAFHSAMMEPMIPDFEKAVGRSTLKAPSLPFVSNVTGTWAVAEEVTKPAYWTRHLREAVQFSRGVETLWAKPERILLEVGPGTTLRTLSKQHPIADPDTRPVALSSVRAPKDPESDLKTLLRTLGELWVAGAAIDFARFYSREKRRRVSLPTYPFERERYWIEANTESQRASRSGASGKRSDVGRWFYVPSWRSALPPDAIPGGATEARGESWLVFLDDEGILERAVRRLRDRDIDVVTVRRGERFAGTTREGFTLSPGTALDYRKLVKQIAKSNRKVGTIVHGWSLGASIAGGSEGPNPTSFEKAQELGYFSLMHLVRAIDEEKWHDEVRLAVVSSELHDVLKGDPIRPERATILGLSKVIPQEHQGVTAVSIDIDTHHPESWVGDGAIEDLVLEIDTSPAGATVAYRRGQRFVQHFEPLTLDPLVGTPPALREGGTYLITGGLGGVTFILAAFLATSVKPRLVLTGRTQLPEREDWARWLEARGETDPVSERIRKVQSLEAWGAEVWVARADAGDAAAMRGVVEDAERRFGSIHGVIHGAGIVGGNTFRPLVQLGTDAVREQFHPKVAGLLALEEALGSRKLDFCMLTSSLSSVLGGFAYGAYASANLFMDAYTRYHNQRSETRWISVNWDEWGLALGAEEPAAEAGAGASGLRAYAMAPAEGAEAFRRLLGLKNADQIVVSSGDLDYRIDQWVKLEALRAPRESGKQKESKARRHPRPNLQSAYLPPGTETERKVAAIWEELLGIDKVGIRDNFFELGGNSLLAIQLVSRIRSELKGEISVASLFEGPTVRSLSQILAPRDETGGLQEDRLERSSGRGARRREERLKRAASGSASPSTAGDGSVAEVGAPTSEEVAR